GRRDGWRARRAVRAARAAVARRPCRAGLGAQPDTPRKDSTRPDSPGSSFLPAMAIVPPPPAVTVPFPIGERLVYGARYGPFSVGTATMQVAGIDTIRGVEAVHFVFLIDGGALWSPIHQNL